MRPGFLLGLIQALLVFNLAHASSPSQTHVELVQAVGQIGVQALAHPFVRQDLIRWKVGDRASYVIISPQVKPAYAISPQAKPAYAIGSPVQIGTMEKTVDHDEGTTLWLRQVTRISGREDIVETQLDRQTAEIVKILHNGQEMPKPPEPEIVSQELTEVTVPAGTFQSIHLVLKLGGASKDIDEWLNPVETVMDGMLKQAVTPLPGVVITLELTSFSAAAR